MEEKQIIKNIHIAKKLLKDGHILLAMVANKKTYFAKKNEKIFIQNDASCYLLSYEEFVELFKDTSFMIYEVKSHDSIDPKKDDEYYSWNPLRY